MAESPTRITEDGLSIERFEICSKNILNRGIIFYGPTASGKTTIMMNFMYAIRNNIHMAFAFAPTNQEKHELDKVIPPMFVYENLDPGLIKDIYERNRAKSTLYNQVHDLDELTPIFKALASPQDRKLDEYICTTTAKTIEKAGTDERRQEIEDISKQKRVMLYRKIIKSAAPHLIPREFLGLYKNMDIRPNALVMFDDATSELGTLIKKEKSKNEETIKNFFFKGRWANLTHFYAFHDDRGLDTDIRKNAHISIFTNKQVAHSYFSRQSNGFSLTQKKIAERHIRAIFNESKLDKFPKYAKLVYIRETDEFMYVVADIIKNFVILPKLHELSAQLKRKDNLNNNKYYRKMVKAN